MSITLKASSFRGIAALVRHTAGFNVHTLKLVAPDGIWTVITQ